MSQNFIMDITQDEQAAILQHCSGLLSSVIVQKLFVAKGQLELTEPQRYELNNAIQSRLDDVRDVFLATVLDKLASITPTGVIADMLDDLLDEDPEKLSTMLNDFIAENGDLKLSEFSDLTVKQQFMLFYNAENCAVEIAENLTFEEVKDAPIYQNVVSLAKLFKSKKKVSIDDIYEDCQKNWVLSDSAEPEQREIDFALAEILVPQTIAVCQIAELIDTVDFLFVATPDMANLAKPENAGELYHVLLVTYLVQLRADEESSEYADLINQMLEGNGYTLYQIGQLKDSNNEINIEESYRKLVQPEFSDPRLVREQGFDADELQMLIDESVFLPMEYLGFVEIKLFANEDGEMIRLLEVKPRYEKAVSFFFED